jgi:hypothetical protein
MVQTFGAIRGLSQEICAKQLRHRRSAQSESTPPKELAAGHIEVEFGCLIHWE